MSARETLKRNIERMVLEIVADHMGLPVPTISVQKNVTEDLGADSLDRMELIMTVEELFRISIPEDGILRIKTIADIIEAVYRTQPTVSDLRLAGCAWRIASRRALVDCDQEERRR